MQTLVEHNIFFEWNKHFKTFFSDGSKEKNEKVGFADENSMSSWHSTLTPWKLPKAKSWAGEGFFKFNEQKKWYKTGKSEAWYLIGEIILFWKVRNIIQKHLHRNSKQNTIWHRRNHEARPERQKPSLFIRRNLFGAQNPSRFKYNPPFAKLFVDELKPEKLCKVERAPQG